MNECESICMPPKMIQRGTIFLLAKLKNKNSLLKFYLFLKMKQKNAYWTKKLVLVKQHFLDIIMIQIQNHVNPLFMV